MHFFVYHNNGPGSTPAQVAADAEDNYQRIHPFAVLDFAFGGNIPLFHADLAQKGILSFTEDLYPTSMYASHPGQIWGYLPPTDYWAELYSSFVCKKILDGPARFAGPGSNGGPRKYGYVYTTDPRYPQLQELGQRILARLEACGITISDTATFPIAGYIAQPDTSGYSTAGMADFFRKGITTVLWGGGLETNFTHAAANLGYYPEWVVSGDAILEGSFNSQGQQESEWAHAWVVTPIAYQPADTDSFGGQAYLSVRPSAAAEEVHIAVAEYPMTRQLFTGIQVVGPALAPASIDQGYHAIPAVRRSNPQVPACYYLPGDYTCVKDAVAQWWDPTAQSLDAGAGCYREPSGGLRHLPAEWSSGDPSSETSPSDPCTAYDARADFNTIYDQAVG